jgi:signal transduction histidine kinase
MADKKAMPPPVPDAGPPPLRALPGALLHCALLTVLTVALAAVTGWSESELALRPLFFALLFSFLRTTGARHPHIHGPAMKLCEAGFLVLTLASATSAVLALLPPQMQATWFAAVRHSLDQGAVSLLGFVLLAYGLVLWIPLVLESHRQLAASMERTKDELHESESARSHMEQRLLDAHRLSMLGELAAGVAHDLRNPLTIVKGAAEALVRKARTQEQVAEHADIIKRGVERADKTIQALIDLGRPRSAARGPIALDEAAAEALRLVQVEGRRKQLRFVATTNRLAVNADRDLLLQALVNLLLNAAHASPHHATVEITARRFRGGDGARVHDVVAIAVEDRGEGIPDDVRHQLFTPFFTTRKGGTGLGLLSCRRIAQELGGGLGLYPRTGGGARALLVLPTAQTPAAPQPRPTHSMQSAQRNAAAIARPSNAGRVP